MPVNPWLPVAQRLAREVAVTDYIYSIDAPNGGASYSIPSSRRARVSRMVALLVIGAAIGLAVPWACGLRLVTAAHKRLGDAVIRVDPRAERWSDHQLQQRLEYRREAMDLIEHTLATTVGNTYPYLSALSGHPSPAIDPGTAPALLMLANALDRFPVGQRGHYVQSIVAVAVALNQPDLQDTLNTLADLKPDLRKRLVANNAQGLKHLFADELVVQDAEAERDRLQAQLSAERVALDGEVKALGTAIESAQRRQRGLMAADRRCSAALVPFRACLAGAAMGGAMP